MSRNGWIESSLGDCFRIKHGWAFKGDFFADSGPYVLLTPGNFREDGGLQAKEEREKFYVGEFPHEFLLKRGELLIVMTDLTQNAPILGSPAIVPCDDRYLHNQRLGKVVRLDESKLTKPFLYHLFNTRDVRQQIKATATGATVRHTAPDRIYSVRTILPPVHVQEHIASILSAYDDLIENNARRVKILDEMAQMVYREWFVNFRFPGHDKVKMVQSQIGVVPAGWCQPYPDYVDYLEGPGLRKWEFRDKGIPFLNVRNLIDHDIETSKSHCVDVEIGSGKYRHFLLGEGDHVVSSSGTLGRIATVRKRHLPVMLNTGIIRMRAKTQAFGKWQIKHFLQSEYFQKQIRALAMGVAQIHFGPSHLKQMKVVVPPVGIGREYEALVDPLEGLVCNLVEQNHNLRASRDLLLPKLVSGEINLEHFEAEALAQNV
jgi:type I restriction enzyme, S subunit